MKKINRVLVTGAAGYIGSILTRQLIENSYHVTGYDNLSFGGESLIGLFNNPKFSFIKGDIRDYKNIKKLLHYHDAVIHLASIVGDPACAKQPELANDINWVASKKLIEAVNDTGTIKRFIFASTCSNYGKMSNNRYVNEDSPLRPVSLYAELKVKFENYLLNSDFRDDLIVTALRFATVYGASPRMRFDLTVNEFVKEAFLGNTIEIYGEQFWRPYTHVEDLARSCVVVLEKSNDLVDRNVFGVGDTNENYQKKMIAEELIKIIPDVKIKYVEKEEDPRDYRVDFSKIKSALGFTLKYNLPDGMKEVHKLLLSGLLGDPNSRRYINI